ncbi:MAG: hypothetical protein ACRDT0_00805 [Pseudonocardiaceae bacterium]
MALASLYADAFTRAQLGPSGMVEVSRNLWARHCQTCGEGLGEETPALVVFEQPRVIEATLHHPRCCPPQWTHLPQPLEASSATDSIRIVALPRAGGGMLPVLLINPSLERVGLRCDPRLGWAVTTVATWAAHGLTPPDSEGEIDITARASGADAWYVDGELVVRVGTTSWTLLVGDERPEITNALAEQGGVAVLVSTAIDPAALVDPTPVNRVVTTGDAVCGFVPFNTGDPVARPDDPRYAQGLFRSEQQDEIPIQPYRGPSYDAATGAFSLGQDGSGNDRYWSLHAPGGPLRNGLMAGPPGCGKTNSLNLVAIEAFSSGRIVPMVADPQDRNGHAERIGVHLPSEQFANDVAGTIRLLHGFSSMIEHRQGAGGFTTPIPKEPGVLLLLEDAHTIFSDPALAELGERIATAGPPVCVAMVVTTETITREAFGGHERLIVALAEHNAQLFSEQVFAQLRVYRSRA